ncbi:MAG: hypothetical protein JWP75_3908 [Frondihabitans sp.]|nr:hypothetical protein [Frondihabitans sp.]
MPRTSSHSASGSNSSVPRKPVVATARAAAARTATALAVALAIALAIAIAIAIGIAATPTMAHAATPPAQAGVAQSEAAQRAATQKATAQPDSWGGYSNGKIPLKALTKASKGYLRPDAAAAYTKMAAAFTTKFRKTLDITEGYRDYATQQSLFTTRYTPHKSKPGEFWSGRYWILKKGQSVAAIPGTSVHGWALAVDFGSNITNAKSAEKKWADANGPTYGWYPVGNTFGEPWHYEFTPPTKK